MIERRNEDCQLLQPTSVICGRLFSRASKLKLTSQLRQIADNLSSLTSYFVNANLNRYHPRAGCPPGDPVRAEIFAV